MKQTRGVLFCVLSLFLVALTVSTMSGCGGSNNSTPAAGPPATGGGTNFSGTQAPGDFWTWTLDSGAATFSATNVTQSLTYSGTVSALSGLSTGISKLTVTASTDANVAPLPQTAYAIGVPDTALIVAHAPFYQSGSGVQQSIEPPIFAVAQGSCPSTGVTVNWITMPPHDWCYSTSDPNPTGNNGNGCQSGAGNAYGTATISVSDGAYGITVNSYELDGTPDPTNPTTLSGCTCSSGLIQCTQGSNTIRISFTPSGVFFVDMPQNAIAGVVQPTPMWTWMISLRPAGHSTPCFIPPWTVPRLRP